MHIKLLGNTFHQFMRRQDVFHLPPIGRTHVHELNEPQRHALAIEVPDHGENLLVVRAFFDDHVDFETTKMPHGISSQAHLLSTLNACQDIRDGVVHIVHDFEDVVAHGVKAHGDAFQAGIFKRLSFLLEQ